MKYCMIKSLKYICEKKFKKINLLQFFKTHIAYVDKNFYKICLPSRQLWDYSSLEVGLQPTGGGPSKHSQLEVAIAC